MTLQERISRILQTRIGERPGNYTYGSRVYLLRDRRYTPEVKLRFAQYAKEDIEQSDPSLHVAKATLKQIKGDLFCAEIVVNGVAVEVIA